MADDRAAAFYLQQAAASQSTQAFLLIGTLVLLPIYLTYSVKKPLNIAGKILEDFLAKGNPSFIENTFARFPGDELSLEIWLFPLDSQGQKQGKSGG